MSMSDLDNMDDASLLTGPDLKGLLKAASLTKYVPDSKANIDPATFEKSANLFDLVRSKIEKPDLSVGPNEEHENLSEFEKVHQESTSNVDALDNEMANVDQIGAEEEVLVEESFDEIIPVDDTSLFSFDDTKETSVERINTEISAGGSVYTELDSNSGPKVGLTDLNNVQENDSQDKNPSEDSYTAAKLEFEKLLQAEKDKFQKLSETLFLVSQTLVEATEVKLKEFILETASKLSGEKIDEIPEKYLSKISGIMDEFSTNADEITVTLNKEDFAAVKEAKNFKDFLYIFDENEDLMRGEFRIKSGKLTGQVKLHENSINNIEPDKQ